MKSIFDNSEWEDKLKELMELHKIFVISEMEPEVDPQVSAQKSRFFKFWCWCKYGHLLDRKGICMRCGKVLNIVKL